VPTPIMALPDQKLVVPRHYRHIGLRRPCTEIQKFRCVFTQEKSGVT